ncbi:Peptidyl-tRNA hydrolase ArfB [Marinomonas gallaica]|uniref:Peptidyl-tRNA hydrolase ArfB n=1 Tax=Marinomonas gallaica TaxID=1806667 RepID=A0A1C3JST8_9GAMM|nr:alternative ribosome rescue aminoacyl-tRNA hydrolase ArfB [Marinomonas gallaica]SBT18166.1 Peptidyl-tRNA hydrolase ArfB [Marinomonas gallaica]SBT22546.1 Peptidyl-tRNA hydrolase ArfB [Marinomonas gallaica]
MPLTISNTIEIPDHEIEMSAIRAQGAGGQNVNKVSSAIHLRFDIVNSSLPERIKEPLLAMKDSRISKDGVLVIKAQQFRTQEANREDALARLLELINQVKTPAKVRRPTKPTKSSQRKRMDGKKQRGQLKNQRQQKWD